MASEPENAVSANSGEARADEPDGPDLPATSTGRAGADESAGGSRRILAGTLIFVCALAVRLFYLWESSDSPIFRMPIVDGQAYDALARALAADGRMREGFFWQPFFYPLFLSVVYFLSGASIVAAKVVQAIVGSGTCVLSYWLGRRLFGQRIGVAAGLIVAFYGPLIFFETEILASGWAAFWAVLLVLAFIRAGERVSPPLWAGVGLIGIFAILTRPTFLPFFVAGTIWLLWRLMRNEAPWLRRLGAVGAFAFALAIVALPVARLNEKVTGVFGILPSSGGLNLYLGNNSDVCETLTIRPGDDWEMLTRLPDRHGVAGDPAAEEAFFFDRVEEYAADDPGGFAKGLARKAIQFVASREIPRNLDIYTLDRWSGVVNVLVWRVGAFGFPFGILLPLAIVGWASQWRKIPPPVVLFVVLYAASIVIVFVAGRYRVPMVPVFAPLAAAGGWTLIDAARQRRWPLFLGGTGIAVAIGLLTAIPGPFCEEKPNYLSEMHYALGVVHAEQGHIDEAIEHYRTALEMQPDLDDAHHNLGTELKDRGRLDEAVTHFHRALELDPDRHSTYNNLAMIHLQRNQLDKAMDMMTEMLRLNPRDHRTHYNLGTLYLQRGNFEAAVEHYESAVELMPGYLPVYKNYAVALERLGRWKQAEEIYRAGIEQGPEQASLWVSLVIVLIRMDRMDDAISAAREGIERVPASADLHYLLGQGLQLRGDLDGARRAYERVLQLVPDHQGANQRLRQLSEKPSENREAETGAGA